MKDIFDSFSGADYFRTLDLQDAFHQFSVAKNDQCKLSFTWNGIQYSFFRAPFGVKTIPSHVSAIMKRVLFHVPKLKQYIDD